MRKLYVSHYGLYTCRGDVERFLRRTRREAGSCGLRVFALQLWGGAARRTGDVHLLPSDIPFETKFFWHGFNHQEVEGDFAPMVDLDKWNEPWWDRRRALLQVMAEENLELTETLLDYCSLKNYDLPHCQFAERPQKFWHPFNGCVQRWGRVPPAWDEEPLIPGGLYTYDEELFRYYVRWSQRLAEEAWAILGRERYRQELWNELGDWEWGAENKERTLTWNKKLVDRMVDYGFDPKRIMISTSLYEREFAEFVHTLSFHGYARPERIGPIPLGLPPERAELSGDGGTDGSGPADCFGHRGLGAGDAEAFAARMKAHNWLTYEAFDFSTEGPYPDGSGCPDNFAQGDVDLFNPKALREFAEEFLERFPVRLCSETDLRANEYCPAVFDGQFVPGTEPREVCSTHKKPEPEPDTRTCYEKYIAGRPMKKWQVGRFLACLLMGK